MIDVSKKFSSFVFWFAEQYYSYKKSIEQQGHENHIIKYKIGNTYEDYLKNKKILIQARKGSAYQYLTPKQILEDSNILGHLHPIDASIITKLSIKTDTNSQKNIKYEVISNQLNKEKLKILNKENNEILVIDIASLANEKSIIDGLHPKDAMKIGWLLGSKYEKIRSTLN